jgi:hypothetical protein
MDKTILYLTDNSLEESIDRVCRRKLIEAAGDLPILSVSQKPMDLGRNVCVGDIGRSWYNIYRQIIWGLEVMETEWLALVEHDVLYTAEHLHYEPTDPDVFHYNSNHWMVQWHGNHPDIEGMYSYWPRRIATSQLICRRDLLLESTREIVDLIDGGVVVERGMHWHGEPGANDYQEYVRCVELAKNGSNAHWHKPLLDHLKKYRSAFFQTGLPNVDIRHRGCFTGPKRGKKRRYELPYWGRFEDVMGVQA